MNSNSSNLLPQPSLYELLYILYKWKWTIVLCAVLTFCTTAFWVAFINEDLYVTEARLIVKAGQEQAPPSTLVGQPANTVAYRSADVKSEIDILQSTELIGRLVEKYELDKERPRPAPKGFLQSVRAKVKGTVRWVRESLEETMVMAGLRERLTAREKTMAGLKMGLKVTVPEGSNTILAELYLPFRVGAGAVLNALLDEYQVFRQEIYRDRGDEFFATEMKERAAALSRAEAALNDFERKAAIRDQPRQMQLLLQDSAEMARLVGEARIRYEEAYQRSEALEKQLKTARPNFGVLGGFEDADFQKSLVLDIATLEKERQQLLLTENEDSERIRNIDGSLKSLGSMLHANLDSVLEQRRSRLDSLETEAASLKQSAEELHDREVKWSELRREVARLDEEYTFYRKRYEESSAARGALESKIGNNVTVIEPAIDPIQAAGVRKTVYLSLSVVVGLLLALAFVALAEFFDPRLYHSSQLENESGVPVLAAIKYRRGGIDPLWPSAGEIGGRS